MLGVLAHRGVVDEDGLDLWFFKKEHLENGYAMQELAHVFSLPKVIPVPVLQKSGARNPAFRCRKQNALIPTRQTQTYLWSEYSMLTDVISPSPTGPPSRLPSPQMLTDVTGPPRQVLPDRC